MQVSDRSWDKSKNHTLPMGTVMANKNNARTGHSGHVQNVDWHVQLLKRLDDLEMANGDILVLYHDNGPNVFRRNGAMKGKKDTTDEGGIRSPLLIR